MTRDNGLDATTFTTWRAPPDAAPVLWPLIETVYMVAFSTLRERKTSLNSLHTRFMAVKNYGTFDVDHAFLRRNSIVSINDVGKKIDSYDNYMLRKRQAQADTQGRIRTESHDQLYTERKVALKELPDDPVCPVENCSAILKVGTRVFKKRLRLLICVQCNARDGYPRNKPKVPWPPKCTTSWCNSTKVSGFGWKKDFGWAYEACRNFTPDVLREVRPSIPDSCMRCGKPVKIR